MTRAAFLIAMALSAAAVAAQEPPPLPLPGTVSKPETKKEKEKKDAAPLLPLPGIDAPKPAQNPPLLPLPVTPKPTEAKTAPESKPPPAAPKPPATTTVKAVPAVDRPSPPAAEKPAARAAATVAQIGDMRLRAAPDTDLWGVRAFVGGERSTEQDYTDAVSHSRLGAEVTRWFGGSWLVRGEFDWRSSTQAYVPLHSAVNAPVKVDENRFDVLATLGYDLGPAILRDGRLEFTPMLGVGYVGIRNQAFPSDLIGPNFGGRVRFALSSAVILHATLAYTFNLAVASVQNSALRSAKGDFNTRAGLALPLSGGYALEIDYSGDVLAFENTYRTAHGAALGFGTSF
ncbi:MAG: hypothetical protein ABR567_19405 [Myxococcales bacterium]|nr:hypothetical protein [Myxococcales bacterium]